MARTADDVLNEDYTYVEPKFAHAFREGWMAAEAAALAARPALDVERLQMQVLRLGGVLDGFEHGVGTRSTKPSDPDDMRWECLCGIGGSPERVERHWLAELRDTRLASLPTEPEAER